MILRVNSYLFLTLEDRHLHMKSILGKTVKLLGGAKCGVGFSDFKH